MPNFLCTSEYIILWPFSDPTKHHFTAHILFCTINLSIGELKMYKEFIKRATDILCSLLGLIILSPIFVILAIAVIVDDPGPVFFAQKRIGKNKNGKIAFFQLYKFRSTCVA